MDSPTASQSSNEGRTLLAATTVAGHGLKHLYAAAFMIVLPEIKASLMLSNLAAGALVTARDVSAGVSTMPSGFLADRFSSKWSIILTISMALLAIGYLAAGTLETYWAVAISISLFGIGVSLWHPSAIASLSARFPTRRGFAISLHGSGGSAGEILGPLIAGGLLLLITWPTTAAIQFHPRRPCRLLRMVCPQESQGPTGCILPQGVFRYLRRSAEEPRIYRRGHPLRLPLYEQSRHHNLRPNLSARRPRVFILGGRYLRIDAAGHRHSYPPHHGLHFR